MLSDKEQKLLVDLQVLLNDAVVPDFFSDQKIVNTKSVLPKEKEDALLKDFQSLFETNDKKKPIEEVAVVDEDEESIVEEEIDDYTEEEQPTDDHPIDEIIASIEETKNNDYIDEVVKILKNNGVQGTGFDASIAGENPDLNKYINDADFIRKELNQIKERVNYLGGGGETKLLRLDDVDTSNIKHNAVLVYDEIEKKIVFVDSNTFTQEYDIPFQIENPSNGDIMQYQNNKWVNEDPTNITDGGNF